MKENKSAPKTKVTNVGVATPTVNPNAAKVYEAIARNIKDSARESADLNDISKDLSSTWADLAKAITIINKNSDVLGDKMSKVTELTKNLYANIEDVGSEYFKQIDLAGELSDIMNDQSDNSTKLLKQQEKYTKGIDKIKELEDKLKELGDDKTKAELATAKRQQRQTKALIKDGELTAERLAKEYEIVSALESANKVLNSAHHQAEKLGFSFESAARTVTGKLEKSFDFMEEIPFLSDVIGLDSIKEKIEKNVKDSLVSSMANGKGAATSLFSAMTTGARTLMTTLGPFLPLIIAAAALYKAFEFDKELTQFSKDLDVSKDTAMGLSIEADAIAGHLGVAGVNGVEVGKAMATVKNAMGATAALANKELVGAVSLLQTRIGLSGEEAMALNSTATLLGTNLNDLAASSYDMADGLIGGEAMLQEMAKLPKSLVAGFKGTTEPLQ